MKKQLLFTIAFFGALCMASAQSNTLTFTGTATDTETFSFGSTAAVYALSDGAVFTQNGNFISHNAAVTSDNPVSESFGINTNGSTVNAFLTFTYRKRAANTASVVISVPGQSDVIFPLGDDSGPDVGVDVLSVDQFMEYNTVFPVSPTTTTVTVTINELTQNAATSVRFRLWNLKINGESSLSTNDIDVQTSAIAAYPNPATNSFQLNSSNTVENVELYNITGRLLKTFKATENYDISDLATGIYIANIKTQYGSKTLRVVKN